jgi:hypothetical protein
MTEHSPVPEDELASAYLDDAVDAADRVRVENTPAVLAEADRLAAIRNAVATSRPIPDPRQRDEHIANAIAELTAAPIDLAGRRERHTRRFAVLTAAAAALVLAGVLALIAGHRNRDTGTSTAARSVATTAASAAAGAQSDLAAPTTRVAEGATPATAGPISTTPQAIAAPSAADDLGTIDAETAPNVLRSARDRRLPPPAACAAPSGAHYVGTAIYEGAPVFAFVAASNGSVRALLVVVTTCVVVADLALT